MTPDAHLLTLPSIQAIEASLLLAEKAGIDVGTVRHQIQAYHAQAHRQHVDACLKQFHKAPDQQTLQQLKSAIRQASLHGVNTDEASDVLNMLNL